MKQILAASAAILLIDQVTKAIAAQDHTVAALRSIGNDSTLAGTIPLRGALLISAAAVMLALFASIGWRLHQRGRANPIVLGLLIGGAAANLIDRILLGYVRDFIWTPYLVFNLADVALVIGVIGFLFGIYRTTGTANPASVSS